mmetsp:Transcript_31276/g.79895  ORF Transcript_31276/g.79895 Transcript_31276/m.79895 type:complete len:243 (-) Transcript_31276:55-783(-)
MGRRLRRLLSARPRQVDPHVQHAGVHHPGRGQARGPAAGRLVEAHREAMPRRGHLCLQALALRGRPVRRRVRPTDGRATGGRPGHARRLHGRLLCRPQGRLQRQAQVGPAPEAEQGALRAQALRADGLPQVLVLEPQDVALHGRALPGGQDDARSAQGVSDRHRVHRLAHTPQGQPDQGAHPSRRALEADRPDRGHLRGPLRLRHAPAVQEDRQGAVSQIVRLLMGSCCARLVFLMCPPTVR